MTFKERFTQKNHLKTQKNEMKNGRQNVFSSPPKIHLNICSLTCRSADHYWSLFLIAFSIAFSTCQLSSGNEVNRSKLPVNSWASTRFVKVDSLKPIAGAIGQKSDQQA
jgi:hypothetical protein